MFQILINGDDPFHPDFILKKPPLIEPLRRGILLNSLSIQVEETERTVWDIRLPSGSFKRIYRLGYGDVPKGFTEIKAQEPLVANIRYYVLASGAGCTGGIEFEIVKKDNGYELMILNN